MSRIIKEIEIQGQPAVALFDSGATYTYVREAVVTQAPRGPVTPPVRVALGGRTIQVRELCRFPPSVTRRKSRRLKRCSN